MTLLQFVESPSKYINKKRGLPHQKNKGFVTFGDAFYLIPCIAYKLFETRKLNNQTPRKTLFCKKILKLGAEALIKNRPKSSKDEILGGCIVSSISLCYFNRTNRFGFHFFALRHKNM